MTNKTKKGINNEDTVPLPYDGEAHSGGTSLTGLTIYALQSKICSHLDWES